MCCDKDSDVRTDIMDPLDVEQARAKEEKAKQEAAEAAKGEADQEDKKDGRT